MRVSSLSALARVGFEDLSRAAAGLNQLAELTDTEPALWHEIFAQAADADKALTFALALAAEERDAWGKAKLNDTASHQLTLARVLGSSSGLGEFLKRNPRALKALFPQPKILPAAPEYLSSLLDSVGARDGFSEMEGEAAWDALRISYRTHLLRIAAFDLQAEDASEVFVPVAEALSDLAAAALEAALAIARTNVVNGIGVGKTFTREEVMGTRLAVIAMGKCGARELNYVSDVDVIFVAESADEASIDQDTAIACATRLATEMMRAIHDVSLEPALWQVDPNLRPEGKNGALVRTLASHLSYYDRWAKSWEFQALLKARFVAGDAQLGEEYVAQTRPFVWNSASKENFVESAQRMRERVTEHIPDDQVEYQLKLGPGGLRDVEFTIQLLQLVHGQKSESIRVRATLDALEQLAHGGFIARADAEHLAQSYKRLRVLEHRLQMRDLTRTALFPSSSEDQRWLARASGFAQTGDELVMQWESTKESVRELHLKIFYAPLLAAAASLPGEEFALTGDEAADRLLAIGFRDPQGALRHIATLSKGVSRRAAIQRNLLPVLLQWLSQGADPDYGLLAFRRISDSLGATPWYLRLLRDGAGAALRLTKLLASSRFVGELMEAIPESVAWLEGDDELQALTKSELRDEMQAILRRHAPIESAMGHLRTVRRREVLRLAMGSLLEVLDFSQVAIGLTELNEALLETVLEGIRSHLHSLEPLTDSSHDGIAFAIVELGRLGGSELGFSSDLDLMYVYSANSVPKEHAAKRAARISQELHELLADPKLPLEIDLDLRPEGKSGPTVRTLDSYRSYYERWSLTWEAQALLRARCEIGDATLTSAFTELANTIRYPNNLAPDQVREIRLLKARVEAERLPQAADPSRHLKLGKGSVSDVEWLVQLRQLQYAHQHANLRVTSTLRAIDACVELELMSADDAKTLRDAWVMSSSLRSAQLLWSNRSSDVLPRDRRDLEGIAQILGYPQGSTTVLEENYLSATRRARAVFEREFFEYTDESGAQGFVAGGGAST